MFSEAVKRKRISIDQEMISNDQELKAISQNGKQKSPGRATSRSRCQPPIPGGREKVAQINVCIANKQMHDKHKGQLPLPKMLKGQKKHIDKEQGKTKHEAPRSVKYRATQNKNNIGTTVR